MRALGVVLLVLGILAFVYTGFEYTSKEKVLEVGPVEVQAEKENTISWPPILGVVLSIAGVVLIVMNKKNI